MSAPTTVRVEVWPVSADTAGLWLLSGTDAWRSEVITQDSDPHSTCEAILSDHNILTDVKLLHSTSWRVNALTATSWRAEDDSVILTYVAVIGCKEFVRDDWPEAAPITPAAAEAVGKTIPVEPTEAPLPRYIDVLLHGLRHLRFLLYTDSAARNALCDRWKNHLAAFGPALAGMYDHDHGEKPIVLPDASMLQKQGRDMIDSATRDQIQKQQQSHAVLGRLLTLATEQGLPAISWTITDAGSGPLIVGNCYASDPIKRQNDFAAWANALSAVEWPNGIRRDGMLRLHAHRKHYDGDVSISISAEIADDER